MGTIRAIQYLRAGAALAVVIFHAAERTGHHFAVGAAGADVFFVISGFVMWVISERRPLAPAKFIADRIRRVVPIYWRLPAVVGLFLLLVIAGLEVRCEKRGGADLYAGRHFWSS
ncbi:exopolysaccharide production protein ExoZ (plasmid) [Sinorhizobium americanum]|uniref:Exopolysaccharide production protein ExoZ n=1 Tax=Sinorhizobium americanum TaxID=194963 RepID=A0A1L3LT73_9HYPH|nr:exopolysaccharide production protein ExoZ [Sinorhizobium americanum CCGM7]APG93280.1 exopolysaccharide production protein ExoZ [Sinorhizobium americanum]